MGGCDLINAMLPDELIMAVFQCLEAKSDCEALSLVCRRWKRLKRTTRRSIRIGGSGVADRLVEHVVDRFEGLHNFFIDDRLPVVSVSPPRFRPSRNTGDMAQAELGDGCPLLKDVFSYCLQITDVGLAHLVRGCTRLKTCHMIGCPLVTAAGVATIVSSCSNIKKVVVEKCKVSERPKRGTSSVLSSLFDL